MTGPLLDTAVDGKWRGGLAVDDGDHRRGGTVDIRNGLERLEGERQIARGTKVVEGDWGRW